jgi:ribosomal protein S18 acetylase RimI-like enzyme
MSLPAFVKSFWHAAAELGERVDRTPWGLVATDSRFPLVWDANTAAVLESVKTLDATDIRDVLVPALHRAGARYEHVEFLETDPPCPALAAFRRSGDRPDPDVVMEFVGQPPEPPSGVVRVEEINRPEPSFWPWYRDSLREFGMGLSEEVLDQLVARTRTTTHPAGERWFVGFIDGERAGYTSLVSLEGVGYLANVVTNPAYRRRGVASATVTEAVRASLAGGDRSVFLLAERDGRPQRLYERLGFRVATPIESFTSLLDGGRAA